MKAHLGKIRGGARYTKSHPVERIEAVWKTEGKSAALRAEIALKRLPRCKKLTLISEPYEIKNKYLTSMQEFDFEVYEQKAL